MTVAWGVLVSLHLAAGALLLFRLARQRAGLTFAATDGPWFRLHASELLLALTLCLGLFSYLYAANAGMDYVQRFIASGGNVRLAPDTRRERLAAALRYGPLLLADLAWLVLARLAPQSRRPAATRAAGAARRLALDRVDDWALPLSLFSALLYALALPSFASPDGFAPIAWVCLVPLFVVLELVPYLRGIFYGTAAGVLATLLVNYWLGTFHLLSLQLATVVALVEYAVFMAAVLWIAKRARSGARFIVLPAAWTVFDWLRSLGFLGYPWGMIGTSQYAAPLVTQIASIGGVWMVTFLVLLVNGAATGTITAALQRISRGGTVARPRGGTAAPRRGSEPHRGSRELRPRGRAASLSLFACFVLAFGWAQWRLSTAGGGAGRADGAGADARPAGTVRMALVQQNSDPRKNDYADTWQTLRRLSDSALADRPDLLVWSETAFVPNIRRWGAMAPDDHPYAALVHELLGWQKGTGVWLLTGNDDYDLRESPNGEERVDYNASILFSPSGERVETYHKIRLVPFTEHFPWKGQLPGLYALLLRFDVHLWEPGSRRVVFRIPGTDFSTPICFEDAFPGEVRAFVRAGAGIIVNLSNDFWSLTEVEAMQHAANAVFRAVENGRPLVRATASGLTCVVDTVGRITARAPLYEEAVIVADVTAVVDRPTLYTRWGDWFPPALAVLLVLVLAAGLTGRDPSARVR
ncbi:MAG: apolipoprotein N-acyltransferase [Spirochaetes bacterium RBG_13_68_11]|nr:MAG: apolipoprotein N-acyltransferase [Spirochaetes bacterium RBG_13_68_11]